MRAYIDYVTVFFIPLAALRQPDLVLGTIASKRAFSVLAKMGEAPPLEMVIRIGLLSTIAGIMKSQFSGSSTISG